MIIGRISPAARVAAAIAVAVTFSLPTAGAEERREIAVAELDAIVMQNPLQPGGETAAMIASFPSGDNELGILVMSRNRLHHHANQDHVLYLARGHGIARLENASGAIETRPIKPGDILSLPRGRRHAFHKTGEENLVFLVLAGPGRDDFADTTFHE
ncbi:MAG: cupin domain-containing protein [Rhizobiales bacterium]|nr:cupin domain-containing protein [Hyphomicrobiales bacterium]